MRPHLLSISHLRVRSSQLGFQISNFLAWLPNLQNLNILKSSVFTCKILSIFTQFSDSCGTRPVCIRYKFIQQLANKLPVSASVMQELTHFLCYKANMSCGQKSTSHLHIIPDGAHTKAQSQSRGTRVLFYIGPDTAF